MDGAWQLVCPKGLCHSHKGTVLLGDSSKAAEDLGLAAFIEVGKEGVVRDVNELEKVDVSFPVASLLGIGCLGNCSVTGCLSSKFPTSNTISCGRGKM